MSLPAIHPSPHCAVSFLSARNDTHTHMCNVDRSLSIRLQWDTQFAVLPPEDKVKIAFKVFVPQAGVFPFVDASNIHSHFSLIFFSIRAILSTVSAL